jgi:dipeptidyl aminopeptidase/acylaminoacyl peptidase
MVLRILLVVTVAATSLAHPDSGASGTLSVDLGDISQRRPPPEFPFERFAQMRELAQLQFSADNRSVYFVDNDGRVNNVFELELASRSTRQVTHFDEPVAAFMVDHGGRFLIIVKDVQGNENNDLYRFDLHSGEVLRLTDAGRGDTSMLCGISPDDKLVYYAQTREHRREAAIWEIDSDGGVARQRLPGDGRTFECDEVSPDGRYLLYAELIGFDTRHLGLLDLATGETRTISAAPGINNLDGSFAGNQVYFRSALGADGFRLWRYRIGDDQPTPVSLPFRNDLESLSMYAEGRVAVIRYRDELSGRSAIFVDGFGTPASFGLPPQSISGAVFSHNDPHTGIVFTETATTPRRYYHVGDGEPALLYDANRSGIRSDQLAEVRSLLIPSFDGLEIPVHLFIPNGTSKQHPRPVIFLIHGGPEDHVDPLYLSNVQFLANRGFIVVVPNVRGSTGFGRHYAALDDGDWGGAHVRDIVAVADAVRTLDFVDNGNLFLAGASFGGFSVMSLITQYPDTFRAAVDFFGFTELATFVNSWPLYLQRHQASALGFDPRIDRQRNRASSPIYHVDRIRIPLQIHQGANDSRVPREQSDWLVQRLRQLGRDVEYFVYADEGHGFTRLANERAAYQRLVAFCRRNLTQEARFPARRLQQPAGAPPWAERRLW